MKKNSCFMIQPYKLGKVWVFDDERFGLDQEPFVGQTNRVIDNMLRIKGLSTDRCAIIFSANEFPEYDAEFTLSETNGTSSWYYDEITETIFWLCPALLHYFPKPPKKIFIKLV